jgi:hypothetical protein
MEEMMDILKVRPKGRDHGDNFIYTHTVRLNHKLLLLLLLLFSLTANGFLPGSC